MENIYNSRAIAIYRHNQIAPLYNFKYFLMNTPPLGWLWLKLTGLCLGYFNSFKDTKKHEDSCTKRFDNRGLMSTSLRILII